MEYPRVPLKRPDLAVEMHDARRKHRLRKSTVAGWTAAGEARRLPPTETGRNDDYRAKR